MTKFVLAGYVRITCQIWEISDTIEAWKFPYSHKNFTHIKINIKKKFTSFYMRSRVSSAH